MLSFYFNKKICCSPQVKSKYGEIAYINLPLALELVNPCLKTWKLVM